MSELETAQEIAEIAVKQVNVFQLQDDKVDFLLNQLNQIASLPQLTIPKSIADELDEELNPLERESMLETFVLGLNYLVLSDELMKFVLTGNNYHVISAYLAGKALGVDLVKVEERG